MQMMLLEQQNKKRLIMARQVGLERMGKLDEETRFVPQEQNRARKIQLASLPSRPPVSHDGGTQREGPIPKQDNHGHKDEGAIRTSPASGPIPTYYHAEPVLPGHTMTKNLSDKYCRQVASTVTYIDPREFSMLDIEDCSITVQLSTTRGRESGISQKLENGISVMETPDQSYPKADPIVSALELQDYVRFLEGQSKTLQRVQAENDALRAGKGPTLHPRWQTLYRLPEEGPEVYFDHPHLVTGEKGKKSLKCSMPLSNIDLHLEKNKDIVFILFKDFREKYEGSLENNGVLKSGKTNTLEFVPFQESIKPVSEELVEAIQALLKSDSNFSQFEDHYKSTGEVAAPYLCIYHTRESYHPVPKEMDHMITDHFDLMRWYILDQFGAEYSCADNMMSSGIITRQYIKYLFKPDQLVLSKEDRSESAYLTTSWPEFSDVQQQRKILQMYKTGPTERDVDEYTICSFEGWSWLFHGSFETKSVILDLRLPKSELEELCITDLNVYPLRYASESVQTRLERRGKILWSCRFRRLVSYQSERSVADAQEAEEERYIVDLETFKKLHPFSPSVISGRDDLGTEMMNSPNPPNKEFLMLLPSEVKGFNLREKKWHDLEVDRIHEVPWNKKAFDNLVLPEKTKKIIRALVTKKLAAEKSTDLIKGKGNGLIILLHGGPGTGKTLTAESIAEMTEKPLYRVTCGDLGTKPEEVEKYMESVLHLGKIWDCVVLLDEADVFLQERNLSDLQRNALVSVFLRVLEYHDGILFLTSNRIGTFDEAFKSRIQLSLHYKALGLPERKKVWRNFIKHLESLSEEKNIDFDDLMDNVEKLATKELNGRQIRNSITLARQLAQYEGEMLNHEHLEDVIKLAADFDDYVKGINEDMSDEDRMRELGFR
jgi:AAA+ superfamily predicted ATPase